MKRNYVPHDWHQMRPGQKAFALCAVPPWLVCLHTIHTSLYLLTAANRALLAQPNETKFRFNFEAGVQYVLKQESNLELGVTWAVMEAWNALCEIQPSQRPFMSV